MPVISTVASPAARRRIADVEYSAKYILEDDIWMPLSAEIVAEVTAMFVIRASFASRMSMFTTLVELTGVKDVSVIKTVGAQRTLSSQSIRDGSTSETLPVVESIAKGLDSAFCTKEYRIVPNAVVIESGSENLTSPRTVPDTAFSITEKEPADIKDPPVVKSPAKVATSLTSRIYTVRGAVSINEEPSVMLTVREYSDVVSKSRIVELDPPETTPLVEEIEKMVVDDNEYVSLPTSDESSSNPRIPPVLAFPELILLVESITAIAPTAGDKSVFSLIVRAKKPEPGTFVALLKNGASLTSITLTVTVTGVESGGTRLFEAVRVIV